MPLLGFQKQFAPLVESGEKRQTIRAYRKDGRDPKVGDRLYLYTGLRTKGSRKLGEAECSSATPVRITRRGIGFEDDDGMFEALTIDGPFGPDGDPLCNYEAAQDGFQDFADMQHWFEKTHGLPFSGMLIRWGDLH